MYFSKFPIIRHQISGNRFKEAFKYTYAVDITSAARILKGVTQEIQVFDEYSVKDFEPPEIVAELLWGQSEWHWIVLLLNDIFHPSDWVLSSREFEEMIVTKYGSVENAMGKIAVYRNENDEVVLPEAFDTPNGKITPYLDFTDEIGFPHVKWYDESGVQVNEPENADTVAGLTAIDYYEIESELNESKRKIKIVSKRVADFISNQYSVLMKTQ